LQRQQQQLQWRDGIGVAAEEALIRGLGLSPVDFVSDSPRPRPKYVAVFVEILQVMITVYSLNEEKSLGKCVSK